MARIPDTALERLKREVSLTRLIEAQGVTLFVQGKDLACTEPPMECINLVEEAA